MPNNLPIFLFLLSYTILKNNILHTQQPPYSPSSTILFYNILNNLSILFPLSSYIIPNSYILHTQQPKYLPLSTILYHIHNLFFPIFLQIN